MKIKTENVLFFGGAGRGKAGRGAEAKVAHGRANHAGDAGQGRPAGRCEGEGERLRRGTGAERRRRQPAVPERERGAAV